MSIDRDQGLEALQRGDTVTAVQALERACQQNPNDFQAHMYLGAAYGQTERHNEAIQALTRAVQIEPSNAQARYNLGIALERGGWPNEARTAFEQALTLQPGYEKAQEGLQRLAQTVAPPPVPPQPTLNMPTAAPAQPEVTTTMPGYGPPPAQEEAPVGLAGYQQIPASQAPPPPGYAPPGQAGYGTPPPTTYGSMPAAPYGAPPGAATQAPVYEDKFDLNQSLQDWGRVLKSPTQFFTEQVGREGLKAPISMLLVYSLFFLILSLVGNLIKDINQLVPVVKGAVSHFIFYLVVSLFVGGLFHVIGKMFGSKASYSGSVRAFVYGLAGLQVMLCLAGLVMPLVRPASSSPQTGYAPPTSSVRIVPAQYRQRGNAGGPSGRTPGRGFGANPNGAPGAGMPNYPGSQANPLASPAFAAAMGSLMIGGVLILIGFVWSTVQMVIGVSSIQGISSGAAFGTVFIGGAVFFVLLLILLFAVGMATILAALSSTPTR